MRHINTLKHTFHCKLSTQTTSIPSIFYIIYIMRRIIFTIIKDYLQHVDSLLLFYSLSFKADPGLKRIVFFGLMIILLAVFGLYPIRSLRSTTSN